MEERSHESSGSSHGAERSEPVRSRWTPRPEQILILESIFNSGMVNPPKDETVRIRKVLEQFGPVGDANVFYWFQNRRSRSRRRQRQIQAGLAGEGMSAPQPAGAIRYDLSSTNSGGCFVTPDSTPTLISSLPSSSSILPSSSTSCGGAAGDGGDYPFSISQQMGVPQIEQNAPSMIWPSDNSNLQYQSGLITVFVNGVPSEVPRGPIDIRAFFGPNVVLLHASGEPVPLNQYGISMHSLQLGENYFLVSRPT